MTATSPAKTALRNIPQNQWHRATWADYVALRDDPSPERIRLAFNEGWLWVTMGAEGISHATVSDLFTSLLFLWAIQHPDQVFSSLGRCLLEQAEVRASAPDLVLYVGPDYPQWQPGEPRRIDLNQTRLPDLVGEISDTTLASDLDEKKHLYAALGIPEYWVVDVRGQRVFAFLLQENGEYLPCETSQALADLPIALLDETLQQLAQGTNTSAAAWLSQQMAALGQKQP
ncbi:Uma2 family endonuclease [Leptolyngbya sp. KIOST-1]|uniref:Uma2 family endonuclease n=1 Tax=Leptolyngbya sp. KIOST-1 TaxID=1229172 RepID=UPI0006925D4B|nr:Uma2 family endonuclease [Leptolyngbya sp. KIOST-1]